MYESRTRPLLPRAQFLRRLVNSVLVGAALILGSLAVGMAGYHFFESLSWLDAFVNASMILSGMGPLANPATVGGKLFAGCYALYSGLVLLASAGVLFAPLFHRFLHRFHLQESAREAAAEKDEAATNTAGAKPATAGRTGRGGRKPRNRQGPEPR